MLEWYDRPECSTTSSLKEELQKRKKVHKQQKSYSIEECPDLLHKAYYKRKGFKPRSTEETVTKYSYNWQTTTYTYLGHVI